MFPTTASTAASMNESYMASIRQAAIKKDAAEKTMHGPRPTRTKEIEAWKENITNLWSIKSNSIQSLASDEIDAHVAFVLAKLPTEIKNMSVRDFRADIESSNSTVLRLFRNLKVEVPKEGPAPATRGIIRGQNQIQNQNIQNNQSSVTDQQSPPRTQSPSGYVISKPAGASQVSSRAGAINTYAVSSSPVNEPALRKRGLNTDVVVKVRTQLKVKSQEIVLPFSGEFAGLGSTKQNLIVDVLNAVLDVYEDELSAKASSSPVKSTGQSPQPKRLALV